jgi:hypothetical protein
MPAAIHVSPAGRYGWLRRLGFGRRAHPCPVCGGLECLCRPRYFAGQMLTEADLTAEQEYALAKRRLHNRYLHGWGVVCGLDVVCHPDCEGWVRVTQGYALDPCGNDVIVCRDVDLSILEMIDECLRSCRKEQPDCPPRRQAQVECDPDGTWCLSVVYEETATRAMASLRRGTERGEPACSCGACEGGGRCGCGHGGGCGCGGGAAPASASGAHVHATPGHAHANGNGYTGTAATAAATPLTTPRGVPCEPTRWCEGYRFELCELDPEDEEHTWAEAFEGTLLGEVLLCLLELQEVFGRAQRDAVAIDRYVAYREARTDLERILREHPTYRCDLLDVVPEPPPPADDIAREPMDTIAAPAAAWHAAVTQSAASLQSVVAVLLRECVCRALLPPCPEDPGDPRVPLAAIRVRGGKLISICTFGCRKQLIGWPSVLWWLSALPLGPLVAQLLEQLCCGERSPRGLLGILGAPGPARFVASNARTEKVADFGAAELADALRSLVGDGR